MPSLVLMIGTADDDLMAFAERVTLSGIGKITMGMAADSKGSLTGQPALTHRQEAQLQSVEEEQALYVVAHGDGTSWGSAKKGEVDLKASVVVEYLVAKLRKGVKVYLCICDSKNSGDELKKARVDLEVWAADGTPKLAWNSVSRTVEDSTGKFVECAGKSRKKSLG
jgi:hypothetical protein